MKLFNILLILLFISTFFVGYNFADSNNKKIINDVSKDSNVTNCIINSILTTKDIIGVNINTIEKSCVYKYTSKSFERGSINGCDVGCVISYKLINNNTVLNLNNSSFYKNCFKECKENV